MDTYLFDETVTRGEGTVLLCYFWGLLPKVNIYTGALVKTYLPTLQVLLRLELSTSLQGPPYRSLSFSPTKLDTPLSQLSFV